MASNLKSRLKANTVRIAIYIRKFFGILKKNSTGIARGFIVAFVVLLSLAAMLASTNSESIAAQIAADIAYITLVIGAILQIISYSKRKKN